MNIPGVNHKVFLRLDEGPWRGRYSTYVEALSEDGLIVAVPMFGGTYVPLRPGDIVTVEYMEGQERMGFSTQVLSRSEERVPLLALAYPAPGSVVRQQLRDFVRLDIGLFVQYAVIPSWSPEAEEDQERVYLTGRTIDISGSGAQIVTAERYPHGTRLELILDLAGHEIYLEAEVVRQSEHPVTKEHCLGVRFTKVDEHDRERIVRFIFREMRARRRKGLM